MDGDKYDCDTSAGQKMLVDIRENKIPGLDHFISNDKEHALHKIQDQDLLSMAQLLSQWSDIEDCYGPVATFPIPDKLLCNSLRIDLGVWWLFGGVCFSYDSYNAAYDKSKNNKERLFRLSTASLDSNVALETDHSKFLMRSVEKLNTLSHPQTQALRSILQWVEQQTVASDDEEW